MATRMTHCGFCRRLTCVRTEAGPASSGQEPGSLNDSPLLPDDVMIQETYCDDCERFYQQLITFERGDTHSAGWNVPEPPVQEIPQPGISTGFPA